MPQGNSAYWEPKISGNKKRDQIVTRDLRRSGWSVLRIWEHELSRANRANVIARIRRALIASGIS